MDFDQANDANYNGAPPIMNPPPQIFGGFGADGSPISSSLQPGMFSDEQLFGNGDELGGPGDAKRRRIARVSTGYTMGVKLLTNAPRHAICVARKRSSVMESSRAGIAKTIRPSVSLRTSRRSGIRRKGPYNPRVG